MEPGPRRRARQACLSCNARRVKCNVLEQSPCANCIAADTTCVLRESRRGRHARRHNKSRNNAIVPQKPSEAQACEGLVLPQTSLGTLSGCSASPSATSSSPVSGHHPSHVILPTSTAVSPTPVDPDNGSQLITGQVQSHEAEAAQTLTGLLNDDTWARPWLYQPQTSNALGCTNYPTNNDNAVADTVPSQDTLDLPAPSRRADEETVFLGESACIRCLQDARPSPAVTDPMNQPFFIVPEAVRADSLTSQWELQRKQSRLKWLEAEGAFAFPSISAMNKLLTAYFCWFHPCFPIIDEQQFWKQYHQQTLSPLLLQVILFVSIMHCHEDDLPSLHLGSRHQAKSILYSRAKDLFDAEIEPKALIVTQALFLMSFWRAGALLQKDTRFWLGAAISLAQTKALHRRPLSRDTSSGLRKRLWWSIYIRERQCAAALGLPSRIQDDDCDVRVLNAEDFEHAFDPKTPQIKISESISYMVGMEELSRKLGYIINKDFAPSKRLAASEREQLREDLVTWRKALPDYMQSTLSLEEPGNPMSFLSSLLHLACNNLLILLYRSGCGNVLDATTDQVNGKIAIQAAARNTSIVEEMLANDHMFHAQIHAITNIFNTLCIHTLVLRDSKGSRRYVAEHRAKMCLLGLRELQKTWEVKNWILQLFFQHLDQPTAARLELRDDISSSATTQKKPTCEGV